MSFSGASVQNAIYIAQQPPEWPIGPEDWERAAEEKLDAGAFGYIAGGAGGESTLRANLAAFDGWRIRPRMLTGNVAARHLGRHPRHALAGAVPARAGRRALDRVRGRRGRRGAGGRLVEGADDRLERRDALARAGRRDRAARAGSSSTGSRIATSAPASSRGPRRRATARSSSRSTRSRSAGGPATCATRTCRSSAARAAGSSSATRSSCRSSTSRRRRICSRRPRRCSRRSRTSGSPGTTSTGCARGPSCRCWSRAS